MSAGQETDQGGRKPQGARYHPRTFYPGESDESKAGVVELAAGAEATGIDITFGRSLKTYSASGRVIAADTGKPVPNVQLIHGMIHETKSANGTSSRGSSSSGGPGADAKGNFRLDGLTPGTFYIRATPEAESSLYSTVVSFQIKDRDITGLEIKIARGSSISGVLEVEGTNDPDVLNKLSQLILLASVSSPDIIRGANTTSRKGIISPDGGFHIQGLPPGKTFLNINSDLKGFSLLRVERDGVKYPDGIDVKSGEHIAGVRLVLGYGSGRIRGQLRIEGGKLPPGAKIQVYAHRVNGSSTTTLLDAEVDPNGRFVVEGLITGEYEIEVNVYSPPSQGEVSTGPLAEPVIKKVFVTSGTDSEVMLVVKLNAKGKDQ